jgi:thiamine-phosphate pyrophosphorylase
MNVSISGLYAITPDLTDTEQLLSLVESALRGGAGVIQYRNKIATPTQRLAQAHALQALCQSYRKPLIINDHLDLAVAVNAAGLHLGGDDGSLSEARRQLKPHQCLGASCYDRLELAQTAVAAGADHIAFGSFFPSSVKPFAPRPPLSLIRSARQLLPVPIVAIGGITLDNAPSLIDAGVSAIALISNLFAATDVYARARQFHNLFVPPTSSHQN